MLPWQLAEYILFFIYFIISDIYFKYWKSFSLLNWKIKYNFHSKIAGKFYI